MEKEDYRGFVIRRHGVRWRWEARHQGNKIKRSFPTLEEARRGIDALVDARSSRAVESSAHDLMAILGDGHLTVAQLCEQWFAWKTGPQTDEPIRAATRHDYRLVIGRYIGPLIGTLDAATVSTNDLRREFFRVCSSRTKARFARTVLKQAFRWGIEERLVARRDNPVIDIKLVRRDSSDGRNRRINTIKAVTDEEIPRPDEIEKMLSWAEEKGKYLWWLWIYITATLGLRPSETCGLRREDFDAASGLVRIRRSTPHQTDPEDWDPKTEASKRDLEVDLEFFETVMPLLPETGLVFAYDALPNRKRSRRKYVIPCWPFYVPCREMQRMRHALGLSETYTPYCLRHFVATRLILAGETDIQVAKWLGTSVEMLQKVYANHLDRDAQRSIGRTVTKLFDRHRARSKSGRGGKVSR